MRQPKWLLVLSFHVLLGCAYIDHVQLASYFPTPMKVVNPVPRTYVRGFGALPLQGVQNIYPVK